ncbi:hypothetical protein TD95_004688 [Thielaviopsis punctulata]|uniref:PH domain-containing protein n=1 Tax=Thielaviopsis punctulata TaxID=72032 RepID=A0A0F4ZCV0_9PEZI|nr:hypothetical protein TD95_004688 [Thielaviopsis punctulata]
MSTPRNGPRPEVGDILWVVHDFQARTSDELTLAKGDFVELVERDDEFGDRWYLGHHLGNGNSGLFPEAYTQPATPEQLRSHGIKAPSLKNAGSPLVSPVSEPAGPTHHPTSVSSPNSLNMNMNLASPIPEITSPVNGMGTSTIGIPSIASPIPQSDSQVLNDTLNVIDEHITHLRSPPSTGALHASTDSGSEYSTQYDHRMSYIQGEETDEEEGDIAHSRMEVQAWGPDDVAEYLFTVGVEKHHCEVFRDQEITGEVLLEMDQSSLFIKAFDLGSVGRRLKTWQKIKSLQDEVASAQVPRRTNTTTNYGSEGSPDRTRSRTNTVTSIGRPDEQRPSSIQTKHVPTNTSTMTPTRLGSMSLRSPPGSAGVAVPESPTHQKRPSAASVRDLHHSRNSFSDYRTSSGFAKIAPPSTSASTDHKKQPSFDRNWTMGGAYTSPRPLSSTGIQDIIAQGQQQQANASTAAATAAAGHGNSGDVNGEMDKGYLSGNEADAGSGSSTKRSLKNLLKRRDSNHVATQSSYTEEQRVRSATAMSRHSRYGSIDASDGVSQTISQKYFGSQSGPHRRTPSSNTTESMRPVPPAKDYPPTVTKLDSPTTTLPTSPASSTKPHDWLSAIKPGHKSSASGSGNALRTISDTVSAPFSKVTSPTESSPLTSPLTRTGSSTPSAGPSFDLDSPDATKSTAASSASGNSRGNPRRKNKQDTSAYQRGLLKISPKEAMKDADYSGWMKKKSSNLMTTWKPRFFILKGRRLSYYYSEDDDQEKGLIDISFHRVLPADNERLTGLHATLTGAGISSVASSEGTEKGDDTMFIFKLTPPRAGLSRAVNFTKPTVHYFAVPNLTQGRLWMAALMKATIERDDTKPITTTYQQKTISLAKARQQRQRPPELRDERANLIAGIPDGQDHHGHLQEEDEEDEEDEQAKQGEADSGVAGMDNGVPQSA